MKQIDFRSVVIGGLLAAVIVLGAGQAAPRGPFEESGRFQHAVTVVPGGQTFIYFSVCDTRTGTVHWMKTDKNGGKEIEGNLAKLGTAGGLWVAPRSAEKGGFIE